jgi:hypothetical protein
MGVTDTFPDGCFRTRRNTVSSLVSYGQSCQESLSGQAAGNVANQSDDFCGTLGLPPVNPRDLRQPLTENLAWAR